MKTLKKLFTLNFHENSNEFQNITNELNQIFKISSDDKLFDYLKSIDSSSNVCTKPLKKGEGAYTCKDCEKDSNCIICSECYKKSIDKHFNHKVTFKSSVNGCCDCGDPSAWNPEGFCSDHKGLISDQNLINKKIEDSFDKDILSSILMYLTNIFELLNSYICYYNKLKETTYIDKICSILVYLSNLANSNFAMLSIIVNLFCNSFLVYTDHTCFIFDSDNLVMRIDDNSYKEDHICKCSIFQNLIRVWSIEFDKKSNISDLLFTFLNSYKFKFLYGFSYISSFENIMKNESEMLRSFYIQVTSDALILKIVESNVFIDYLFEKFFKLAEEYSNNNSLSLLQSLVFNFFLNIYYLVKPITAELLSNNYKIFFKLIDSMCLFHNLNKLRIANSFQFEGFNEDYISIELYSLNLFSLMTTNLNFNNISNVNEIMFYIIDKIRVYESYSLKNDFSFNITLNRILAIFINRYAFHISKYLNIDLTEAIRQLLLSYYNTINNIDYSYYNLLNDIISGSLRFLGFINSIKSKYWVYYGENMLFYHQIYYTDNIFYLCDFTLLKLIYSQDNEFKLSSISNFLEITNMSNMYKSELDKLLNNTCQETSSKGTMLIIKNLENLLNIYLNDSYILDLLAYSYERIKMHKNIDQLLIKILKEDDGLINAIENRIMHIIIGSQNNIYFTEIQKSLPNYIVDFIKIDEIENILNKICEKLSGINKPITYRLKKEFLKFIDLYSIIDPKKRTDAERYLMEFNKNETCLINTPKLVDIKSSSNINKKLFESLKTNKDNIKFCGNNIVFFLRHLNNKNKVSHNFIYVFMKFLNLILIVNNDGMNINYNFDELIKLLKLQYSDLFMGNCANYLLNTITKDSEYKYTDNIIDKINKKNEMQEKYSKMFKEKNQSFKRNFINQYDSEEDNIDEKNLLDCVICREKIHIKDFINNPFGRMGTISCSSFIYQAKIETLKKEYWKIKNNLLVFDKEDEEKKLLKHLMCNYKKSKPELKKSIRFTSCNHFMHYKCYIDNISHNIIDNNKDLKLICHLCRTISNCFIPYIDKNSVSLKGIKFEELFSLFTDDSKNDIISTYSSILPNDKIICSVSNFIENIISIQSSSNFLIKDFHDNVNYYNAMKNFFINALFLIDVYQNYENIISILKDYLFSIRLLIKNNIIQACFFFKRLYEVHNYVDSKYVNEIVSTIDNDIVSDLIYENIFLILVLSEENELNYFNIIFKHFIPLIFIQFFIIQFHINFSFEVDKEIFENKFLKDNLLFILNSASHTQQIKKHLNIYLRKLLLIKNIFKDNTKMKEKFNDIDNEFSYYCQEMNYGTDYKIIDFLVYDETLYPTYWSIKNDTKLCLKSLFKSYYDIKINDIKNGEYSFLINPSLLLITNEISIDFVELPNTLLELSSIYYPIKCNYCRTNPTYAILCLSCGEKLCYVNTCCNNMGKKKNLLEYQYHNKICGRGDGMYLHLYNGQITYSLLNIFVNTGISIYQNKHGEQLKGNVITEEYVLNEETYKNMLEDYKNYTYCKYFKKPTDNSLQDDEET